MRTIQCKRMLAGTQMSQLQANRVHIHEVQEPNCAGVSCKQCVYAFIFDCLCPGLLLFSHECPLFDFPVFPYLQLFLSVSFLLIHFSFQISLFSLSSSHTALPLCFLAIFHSCLHLFRYCCGSSIQGRR